MVGMFDKIPWIGFKITWVNKTVGRGGNFAVMGSMT